MGKYKYGYHIDDKKRYEDIERKYSTGKWYDHPIVCLWGELGDDFKPIHDFHIEPMEERRNISKFWDIFNGNFGHEYRPMKRFR